MTPDSELLGRYVQAKSEDAFGELVRRHLDLVYSAALRQVNGDAHLAQDVAQTVFTDLANKAAGLADRTVLTGWLYTSTYFAAAKAVRTERRRQAREQEVSAMNELLRDSGPDLDWDKLRPVLDHAMHELDATDREVILMRYFENRKHADIGERLGLTENGARMRVERALDKLRAVLSKRGITTATLGATLSANAVTVAPVGLAVIVTTGALSGIATTAAVLTTAKEVALTMAQKILFATIIVAAVGIGIYEAQKSAGLQSEIESLRQRQAPFTNQLAQLTAENIRLSNLVALAQGGPAYKSFQHESIGGKAGTSGAMSELEKLLREAMKLPDGQRQKRLEDLGRSIEIADIPAAMNIAEPVLTSDPDRMLFQGAMMFRWAEIDPAGALDFALAYAPAKARPDELKKFVATVLQSWAARDPGAALAWVERLPASPEQQNYYAIALMAMAERDPEGAVARLKEMPAGRERVAILQRIAAVLGNRNPTAAAEFGKALPAGSSRDQFLQQLAAVWIGKDPKAAVNFILQLPASGSRDELMRNAVSAWARVDPGEAAKFSETLPFNRMWSMTGVGYNWAISDPAAAWQWSLTIADDETRRSSLGGVLRALATHSKLDEAASYASQLNGDDQVRAVRSLLIDSSDLDPEWTARWVATFPEGETRNQAVEKLVQHWSESDPIATAKWLAEQPRDAAFESGARRLIPGMIKASPATAWEWAIALTDPVVRQERLELVAKSWLNSNASAAQQRIQSSGLPADQIERLLAQSR